MQAPTAAETRSDQAAAGQGAPGSPQRTWSAVVAAWAGGAGQSAHPPPLPPLVGGVPAVHGRRLRPATHHQRRRQRLDRQPAARMAGPPAPSSPASPPAPACSTSSPATRPSCSPIATAALRTNPFRNEAVRRPRVCPYSSPQPLADATVQRMLRAHQHRLPERRARPCAAAHRADHRLADGGPGGPALGGSVRSRRATRPSNCGSAQGADGAREPLPPAACAAIRHYLTLAGRWPLGPRATSSGCRCARDGVVNFRSRAAGCPPAHQRQPGQQHPAPAAAAGRRGNPEQYHLRDLRHTFSRKYLAVGGDADGLGCRLEHARPSVTQRYIARLAQPVDDARSWRAGCDRCSSPAKAPGAWLSNASRSSWTGSTRNH